jgi:hypothetical protein
MAKLFEAMGGPAAEAAWPASGAWPASDAWPASGAWLASDAWPASGAWPAGDWPDPGVRPRAAHASEACPECAGPLRRSANNLEHVCGECGLVVEGDTAEPDDDGARQVADAPRLRIVGSGSSQLQPDLYRSGAGTTAATQRKQIFEEYLAYNLYYIEAGGRAFPQDACRRAAEYYNVIQRQCVKRAQNKKTIMAVCLMRGCHECGFAPTRAQVAAFMQLQTRGIARGDNFLRGFIADGKIDIEANADPTRAEIATLFAYLGLEGDEHAGLREAVRDVVLTAVANNIGTNSMLRSKVAGATFAVLRRSPARDLAPKAKNLRDFCATGQIRKNTVERFTRELDAYHASYFEPCYARAGLSTAALR